MTDSCKLWTGSVTKGGYGLVWSAGKTRLAHRVAYEAAHGPIPAGLEIDHLCRTPGCVNPDHMEPVKHKENIRRSVHPTRGAHQRNKTHCPQGHEYSVENTGYTFVPVKQMDPYVSSTPTSCQMQRPAG